MLLDTGTASAFLAMDTQLSDTGQDHAIKPHRCAWCSALQRLGGGVSAAVWHGGPADRSPDKGRHWLSPCHFHLPQVIVLMAAACFRSLRLQDSPVRPQGAEPAAAAAVHTPCKPELPCLLAYLGSQHSSRCHLLTPVAGGGTSCIMPSPHTLCPLDSCGSLGLWLLGLD